MLMRMVKWCGITCLQLVAAILCIICLGALPRLFKGLQIDLIGFGTRLYFLEESYFNRVKLHMDFGTQQNYFRKYGFIILKR